MEWQDLKCGFSMATVAEGEPLEIAMREFFKRIEADVLPKNEGVDWNYIRVEFWADSGRMIAFPASRTKNERIEKAGCQVAFEELLAQYEELADSDMEDEAFTAALIDVERTWIERFVAAARESGMSGQQIQFWDGDGEKAILEVVI